MLRKLRIKFICVNMLIVALMLLVIFGLVLKFTQVNLEQQSLSMMEQLAEDPFRLSLPGEQREDIQLPYFVLQLGRSGDLIAVSGGYYDLSDQEFLAKGQLILRTMGTRNREESIAHNLFSVLREMDEVQAEYIVAEGVNTEAIGYAVMNRMKKAAAQQVIYV